LSRDFSESRLHPYSALIASSEDILPTDLGNTVRSPCRFGFPCLAIAISWPSQRVRPATASIRIACSYGAIRKLRFSNSTRRGLAARGDPSCMIGISETPGASNRVGKKAASVGYSHVGISHGPTASFFGCGWRFRGRRLLLSTRKGLLKRIKFAALSGNLVG
jgi:hypothetical protein